MKTGSNRISSLMPLSPIVLILTVVPSALFTVTPLSNTPKATESRTVEAHFPLLVTHEMIDEQ